MVCLVPSALQDATIAATSQRWYIRLVRGGMQMLNTGKWICVETGRASQQGTSLTAICAAAGVGMCLLPNVVISAARRTLWPHDFQIIQARPAHSRPVRR